MKGGVATLLAAIGCLFAPTSAHAYTVVISAGSSMLYLQIGVGTGTYNPGANPVPNPNITTVSVSVPVTAAAGGIALPMSSGIATSSFIDGVPFCAMGQLYIGALHRRNALAIFASSATLNASSPASLTNGTGQTIPFTEISWTSGGSRGDGSPFGGGTFVGGTQTIGSVAINQFAENCHTFSYQNSTVRAGGTYTGRVTYTLVTL